MSQVSCETFRKRGVHTHLQNSNKYTSPRKKNGIAFVF